MSSEKKFLPKRYPASGDLKKTWFILYTNTDGERIKKYGNLNNLATFDERLTEAQRIIDEINSTASIKTTNSRGNQLIRDLDEVYEMRKPLWKSKTISAYQTHLNSFVYWFRKSGCPEIDTRQITLFLNYILSKGSSATTRNNYRKNLGSLFKDICTNYPNRYKTNPFVGVRKMAQASRTKEWFRPERILEAVNTIRKCNNDLYLAIKIMYHCFGRPNELRQLRVADINFDTQKLRFESVVSKVSRIRYVPIPDILMRELIVFKNYQSNFFLFSKDGGAGEISTSRDMLSKLHKGAIEKLNLTKGYTFYSWKNTGAVKMLMHDRKPMRYISKCMGHRSLDMTDKYFESLGVDEMAETIIFPEW